LIDLIVKVRIHESLFGQGNYELECAFQHLYVPHSGPHRMDQQNNNRKRKDLRQILKEPKLKHKNDPVVGRETDSTQCETFGS
jgi:hypothetical protein